ncbi:hypothetical protein [Natronobeatus ordinarius]|uniref:hypothetical protein n=1 Tax=Natronobeatus ordinarius TaxID=2963433 RepID=UPI0020CFD959|nr:hypothetical protein [Natronobeatus ordinarius]
MPNDDSREPKSPDRTREPTTKTENAGGLTDAARLEAIDRLAAALLERTQSGDEDRPEFTRHCREIRAEVECARRALSDADGMVRARGVATTSCLGPHPGTVVRGGECGGTEKRRGVRGDELDGEGDDEPDGERDDEPDGEGTDEN